MEGKVKKDCNFNFMRLLMSAKHLEEILTIVDRMLVDFMKVEAYRIILLDSNAHPWIVKSNGIKEQYLETDFDKGVIDTVIRTAEPFINIDSNSLEIVNRNNSKIILCIPLEHQGKIKGLIEIVRLKENESISFDKYVILLNFAHLIAINRAFTQVTHQCKSQAILWHRRAKEYIRTLV